MEERSTDVARITGHRGIQFSESCWSGGCVRTWDVHLEMILCGLWVTASHVRMGWLSGGVVDVSPGFVEDS